MGLKPAQKGILYRLERLTHLDVIDIARQRAQNSSDSSEFSSQRPVIDADCNNIINVVGQKSDDPVEATAHCLMKWAHRGAIIVPICDGIRRPVAKQASNKNRAARVKASNEAIIARQQLQALNNKLEHELLDNAQRTQLMKDRLKLEKKIKAAETQSTNVVPSEFPAMLAASLKRLEADKPHQVTGGYVASVLTSWFQADALIGGRFLKGDAQLIISNDGDIPALFGDKCIAIKKFTGDNLTISSSSKETLEHAKSCLSPQSQNKTNLIIPKHPIFEGIKSLKLRALVAVVIGCDVCPSGVKGVGPSSVEKVLKETIDGFGLDEDIRYNKLMDHAVHESRPNAKKTSEPKYSKEVLTAFVHGIIYEPTNEHRSGNDEQPIPTYLTGAAPQSLCKYLEEFRSAYTVIVEGPKVLKCKGSSTDFSASHDFLSSECHYVCNKCDATICHFCSDSINGNHYCLSCFINDKVLPCTDQNPLPSIREMRDELKYKYSFTNIDKLRIGEIQNAWESHDLHRELEKMVDSVNFPLLPTSAITKGNLWAEIARIDFSFGGSFLLDEKIDAHLIPDILELFAAFVKFDFDGKKYTNWEKDSPVFSAVPEMYIKFANGCRAKGVGYRLLKRCLRHVFDSRMESLDNKKATLIQYNGEIGIHITTKVPASMKDERYIGDTVITKDKLLATSCSCKSGSNGEEKIACVHSLPRAFALSKLLAEDLAEHMLLELTSSLTSLNVENDNWNEEQIDSMRSSILILARASGNSELAEEMSKNNTLYEMLQHYQTGTQKVKEWNRSSGGPPRPDEIGPITKILSESSTPVQDAKKLFGHAGDKPSPDPKEEIESFVPDYVQIGLLLNAAGIKTSDFPFVGFKLFELRKKKQIQKQPIDDVDYSRRLFESSEKWKCLLEEATERRTRRNASQTANLKTRTTTTPSSRKRKRDSEVIISPSPRVESVSSRKPNNRCAKVGCCNTSNMKWLSFHRVPKHPGDSPSNATKKQRIAYRGKLWIRQESMDRLGYSRDEKSEAMRVCSAHGIETIRKSLEVTHGNKRFTQLYEFTLIPGAGSKSSLCPSQQSKGIGRDRLITRHLSSVSEKRQKQKNTSASNLSTDDEIDKERRMREEAQANAADAWMFAQQVVECASHCEAQPISPSVQAAAGLVPFKQPTNSHPVHDKLFLWNAVIPDQDQGTKQQRSANKPAKYDPRTITDDEVKRRTGFSTLNNLLGYIIIICNGDTERIKGVRRESLTWFEHFFLYFEWTYHNTVQRKTDLKNEWGIHYQYVNKIRDSVAALEVASLQGWPLVATFEEDMSLRDCQKWSAYNGKRAIFHDMTNVKCPQFENASLQRATYSEYYGENCFKAGVFCQLSGWIGVWELWTGGVSDSDYNKRSGYLQAQQLFQETDLVDGETKKFHNVYDRGYRAQMATWQCGNQMAVAPPNAKSDKRFKGRQTIYTGIIAHDRSGNERSVRMSKRSALFKRGFQVGMSPKRFNFAWRGWAYRTNFMYKPVL